MEKIKGWFINYIKHKDIFYKRIKDIEDHGNSLTVHYNDKDEQVFFMESIHEFRTEDKDKGEHYTLVLPNKISNIKELVSNWDNIIRFDNMKIIFVNLSENSKWIIMPSVHNKVADKENLEEGFLGLSENVGFVE